MIDRTQGLISLRDIVITMLVEYRQSNGFLEENMGKDRAEKEPSYIYGKGNINAAEFVLEKINKLIADEETIEIIRCTSEKSKQL